MFSTSAGLNSVTGNPAHVTWGRIDDGGGGGLVQPQPASTGIGRQESNAASAGRRMLYRWREERIVGWPPARSWIERGDAAMSSIHAGPYRVQNCGAAAVPHER